MQHEGSKFVPSSCTRQIAGIHNCRKRSAMCHHAHMLLAGKVHLTMAATVQITVYKQCKFGSSCAGGMKTLAMPCPHLVLILRATKHSAEKWMAELPLQCLMMKRAPVPASPTVARLACAS
jgi:hypothetical protein